VSGAPHMGVLAQIADVILEPDEAWMQRPRSNPRSTSNSHRSVSMDSKSIGCGAHLHQNGAEGAGRDSDDLLRTAPEAICRRSITESGPGHVQGQRPLRQFGGLAGDGKDAGLAPDRSAAAKS